MKKINTQRKIKEIDSFLRIITKGGTKKIHILNIGIVVHLIKFVIKVLFLDKLGYKNALKLQTKYVEYNVPDLPDDFSGMKILFMSDFHLDAFSEMKDILVKRISQIDFDICIFGGDYRFLNNGISIIAKNYINEVVAEIKKKSDIYAVLGNHDEYEFAEYLDSIGVNMLLNDSVAIKKGKGLINVCGIDDAGYYGAHDFKEVRESIVERSPFNIIVSHTPDVYRDADEEGYNLFLAGHTHAGQLCLPGGIPLLTETKAPRRMVYGPWKYKNMRGYTTSGIGCSGIVARFFCPAEIVVIELKKVFAE